MRPLLFAAVLSLLSFPSLAAPTTLRVAILENLKFEKLSTDKYASDYLDGIKLAQEMGAKHGYNVEVQTFFYGKEPLAILEKVPEVLKWQPDLVIGPRTSSLFLMLKDQIKDVLVLSPFATANAVADLPENFYSMTLPNRYFMQAAVNLAREKFPNRAVAPIVEVDCKNCVDFADEFSKIAPSAGLAVRERSNYLNKNVENADLKQLLANVRDNDLLLVPNTSYTSGAIIPRIANHLRRTELVVIGGDGWGDWSSSYVGKVKSDFSYTGYRVTPWSLTVQTDRTNRFISDFKAARGAPPTGTASLLSYATLSAAVDVLPKGGLKRDSGSVKAVLLNAFQKRLKNDPNYGRPTRYAIYKVTQSGESFVGEVSALKAEAE